MNRNSSFLKPFFWIATYSSKIIALIAMVALLSGCVTGAFEAGQEQQKTAQATAQGTGTAVSGSQTTTITQTGQVTTTGSITQTGQVTSTTGITPTGQITTTTGITPTGQTSANLGQPSVSFTLKTGLAGEKMAFIGVGGDIEGVANPILQVKPGDVVEIILVNGDGVQHNFNIDELNVASQDVQTIDQETRVVFKTDQAGTFAYYCAVAGHRLAGMEGKVVVGEAAAAVAENLASVSRAPDDLPGGPDLSEPGKARIDLQTVEVTARLADGVSYTFWTFNGQVPGPFLRVRVGDTVDVYLKNDADSTMMHSVDFHAVTGPGGGSVATQTSPGGETHFTFKALNPGLYVYHCATPVVPQHITNGMYGLILVEPEGGLPPVDREFYVMQGEIYTAEPFGQKGATTFSEEKLLNETPEYFLLNGSVGALTEQAPLKTEVGETIRIFFGVGGPNFTSSFHVIGEIFDRVFDQASLTSDPLTNVQTTLVPPGGATMVEFTVEVPGTYILVDHALSRLVRGLAGYLIVEGEPAPEIFNGDPSE